MRLRIIICALFSFFVFTKKTVGQNQRILDSLLNLSKTVNDTTKANLYNIIATLYAGNNNDKNKEYGYKIIEIGKKSGYEKYVALGNMKIGIYHYVNNQLDSSKFYYEKALALAIKNSRLNLESFIRQNLALIYVDQTNYEKAIEQDLMAMAIQEKLKNSFNVANLKSNIGIIYIKQKDMISAEKYIKDAILELQKNNVPGTFCYVYQNMGIIENYRGNFALSNTYYKKALLEYEIGANYSIMSDCLQNISLNFINLKMYDSANYYNRKANQLAKSTSNEMMQFLTFINFSTLNQRFFNKPKVSKSFIDSASKYTNVISLPEYRSVFLQEKALYNLVYGDKDLGYNLFDKYITLKDSIVSLENIESVKNMNSKYETEKKELQIKTQSVEIEAQEKQNKQKSLIILFGSLALVGSGFFGSLAFINFRKTKKANIIIENQKMEVELKNEEITHQKELVDEKQKEIIDSINYAKRIQQAVLTGEDVWNKVSKDHFILFKPKDIVSGDFYWAYNTPNNRSIFALADCTGHGVPGGFMSMLGNSFLNEIVVENKIFKANEILNKLRSKIIKALEQKGGTQQRDGMDISLCVWNKIDNSLEFAGANNPLWLLRNSVSSSGVESKELLEYKADKMPIGLYLETEIPFSSITIQLEKGDIIYLSTDGYADQFGGPKGKKLKYKSLIEMLVKNSVQSMETQKVILDKSFADWKDKQEQVDDVSVIGIRV
ncbi:MAG: SpoIIE family protein phosphatase [Bacteroidota bacterium]